MATAAEILVPQPGQMVTLRARPAVVRDVVAYGTPVLHAVEVDYIDGWEHPPSDRVIWQYERDARVHPGQTMPQVERSQPDLPERLLAVQHAFRWEALNQLTAARSAEAEALRLISPWQGAVQIEDYQIYPILKALAMPRVGLLIADDVGLGKTIEAGLILTELIARRRIRRALILCPAALQQQWRDEMHSKFFLNFQIVDRDATFKLRRVQGIDTNPWSAWPHIITSFDYLRQATVLQEFQGASDGISKGSQTALPWNLLIVDEAHNLAPAAFGDDSQRAEMLRQVAPRCEHRIFLTATPHNGYTLTYTGLLETLDPLHFQREAPISSATRQAIQRSVVRRLKEELNVPGEPPRFPRRTVRPLPVHLSAEELALFAAVRAYRLAVLASVGEQRAGRRIADFVVTILTKRLLSSTYAFARTWWQHVEAAPAVDDATLTATIHRAQQDVADDAERQERDDDVARLSGSWLHQRAPQLAATRQQVNAALTALGWEREQLLAVAAHGWDANMPLPPDARWEALARWLRDHLRSGAAWRADERAVIFTEYKDTLEYLAWRMHREGYGDPAVLTIFGGAESAVREAVKASFSDAASPARVLLGTDAVSEGINLQASCRYVLHADIPWNPMRLEQRNGRVDRHGQARDVVCWHFTSDDEADLRFLSHVVGKIDTARHDLGSVGTVIDTAIIARFTAREDAPDSAELERRLTELAAAAPDALDLQGLGSGSLAENLHARQQLAVTEAELELHPAALANLLAQAVALEGGALTERTDTPGFYDLRVPPGWKTLVEDALLLPKTRALPKIAFDPALLQHTINGRSLFRPRTDVALVRLAHPLMRRAVQTLRRRLWDDADGQLARWTVAAQALPGQIETVLVVHAIIEATNTLRETLHQEVVALPFEVRGALLVPLDARLWDQVRLHPTTALPAVQVLAEVARLRALWHDHATVLRTRLDALRQRQTADLRQIALLRLHEELVAARALFAERRAALDRQRDPHERQRRQREQEALTRAQARLLQPRLFAVEEAERVARLQSLAVRQRELEEQTIRDHVDQMQALIAAEEQRTIADILPRRYQLADHAPTVLPLTVTYFVRA